MTAVYCKVLNQFSAEFDDEIVILNVDRAIYFGLRGAAVQIWHELAKPKSKTQLCQAVMAHFEVSAEECEADVQQVLTDLQTEGLIECAK